MRQRYLSCCLEQHAPKTTRRFIGIPGENHPKSVYRPLAAGAHAFKRSGGQVSLALEELGNCVSENSSLENDAICRETLRSIQRFLDTLTPIERGVFVCRYWYLDTSKEIADKTGFSRGKVRTMLRRIRIRLNAHLEKEGLA